MFHTLLGQVYAYKLNFTSCWAKSVEGRSETMLWPITYTFLCSHTVCKTMLSRLFLFKNGEGKIRNIVPAAFNSHLRYSVYGCFVFQSSYLVEKSSRSIHENEALRGHLTQLGAHRKWVEVSGEHAKNIKGTRGKKPGGGGDGKVFMPWKQRAPIQLSSPWRETDKPQDWQEGLWERPAASGLPRPQTPPTSLSFYFRWAHRKWQPTSASVCGLIGGMMGRAARGPLGTSVPSLL